MAERVEEWKAVDWRNRMREQLSQAERLASMGFNLLRLHHHDSRWVEPNVFRPGASTTQELDPSSIDKLGLNTVMVVPIMVDDETVGLVQTAGFETAVTCEDAFVTSTVGKLRIPRRTLSSTAGSVWSERLKELKGP